MRREVLLRRSDVMRRPTLNAGQQQVITSEAPLIVVSAGAGSGKTRVLAERFTDLVMKAERAGETSPIRSVLLITFTDKAAGELVERVRRVFIERGRPDLARDVDQAWISTIHGFCARIVRRHALELGIDPAFCILAEPEVGTIRRDAFEKAATDYMAGREGSIVERCGPEVLRSTVQRCHDTIRSRGMTPDAVVPPPPGDLGAALVELLRRLDEVLPAYRTLPPTATILANLDDFTALGSDARQLLGRLADIDVRDAAMALTARRGACRGSQEMKDLTASVNAAIGSVAQAAVDDSARALSAEWIGLLVSYDREYAALKAARGALDFEDLQLLTRRLWQERPKTAARYASQFSEVMVDEFQDTNSLQMQVIEPLAEGGLCVVGDAQQSIYRFRDADVALLMGKRTDAEAADDGGSCRLTVNYRSHPSLLAPLNALFARTDFFGEGYLDLEHEILKESPVTWPEDRPRVEALVIDKAACGDPHWRDVEARQLAARLREMVDEGSATPDDIVVLVRAGTTMGPFVTALRDAGFEVLAGSGGGFHGTSEMADVRALLGVLANQLDDVAVLALLAGGLGGVSDDALFLLARRARLGLWEAVAACDEAPVGEADRERLKMIGAVVGTLRGSLGRMRLADTILHAVASLGEGGGCLARPAAWANVQKIARIAADFERTTPADPAAFIRHLDERQAYVSREPVAGMAVEGSGAVRVMTVHAAKGLEFPVVAVADLGHQANRSRPRFLVSDQDGELVACCRLPDDLPCGDIRPTAWQAACASEDELDDAESKRVFYVACTRAEQVLLLTGSADLSKPADPTTAIGWILALEGSVPGIAVTTVDGEPHLATPVTMPPPAPVGEAPEQVERRSVLAPAILPPDVIPAPDEISYTALSLYERCGYRFFAERVLGVGSLKVRADGDPLSFGSALHGALQLEALGTTVDADRIAALAHAHGLGTDEIPRLGSAIAAVRGCASWDLVHAGSPEVPFVLPVEGGIVRGNMDLVVRDGEHATVLDYKTGEGDTTADDPAYRAQAEIYALALLGSGFTSVEVRFLKIEERCREIVFEFSTGDAASIEKRVQSAFSAMRQGRYDRPAHFDSGTCPDCPVSGGLCPIVHPGSRTDPRLTEGRA